MPASKSRKAPERPTTRASTKIAHTNGDFAVKQRLRSYPNAVTPSSTGSPSTTRASSVESAREATHRKASSRTSTRSCHNNKSDGVMTRRSILQKEHMEDTEILFDSHSSDDEDAINLKRNYRTQKRRADEIVIQFKSLKERVYFSRLNDLDEENSAIQEGLHPTLSKQMDDIEEKHRALTLRAEKRRDHHKNAIETVFAAQEKQIRDEFLNDRHRLRTMMIEELEMKKSQLKREYYKKPEDNLLDLVMKKIEGTPFDPNYKVVNKGSDVRISSPVYSRLQNGTNEEEMAEDLMAMQLRKPIRPQLPPPQPLQISSSSQFHSMTSHPNIIPPTSSVSISSSRRKKEPRAKRIRRSSNRESVSETRRETPIILAPKEFPKASLRELSKVPKTVHSSELPKELPRILSSKEVSLYREPREQVIREVIRERPREPLREGSKDLSIDTSKNPILDRWLAEGTEDNDSDQ
ncbi:hypothetical protein C1646_667178 [Rhizophagus diaphanus]|nr:hypothetical protein C1646_667178 [Rhizophagus diaphanus] [Rhizophagus sp. MUCL 43196]